MLSTILSYFRACYQADNRSLTLPNFFSSKVENHLILTDADLLAGHLPKVGVDPVWATDVAKNLSVYTKEKIIYCCSLFLSGYTTTAGKKQRVCAPLYLHPVQLTEQEGDFYVSIDIDQPVFNAAGIKLISPPGLELYDTLVEKLPLGFIDFGACGDIHRIFQALFPEVDTHELLLFPRLYDAAAINQHYQTLTTPNSFSLIPAVGLGVIRKSSATLGVLSELKEMARAEDFSSPLQTLFFPSREHHSSKKTREIKVPVVLSHAQEKVFRASDCHSHTLVIGPPGTGKSFTIAALAVDYLSRGKSVLIASSNNQAVDVIADKIERDFGLHGVVVRGGRQHYKKLLKNRLENMLSGIGVEEVDQSLLRQLKNKITALNRTLARLEKKLCQRGQQEVKRGGWLARGSRGWLYDVRSAYIKWRSEHSGSYHQLLSQFEKALQQREQAVKKYLVMKFHDQLTITLHSHRHELQLFLKAIRARTAQRKELLFDTIEFGRLQKAFPVWLVNLSDVSNVLPLIKESFDLVIIDEATQCDIASALPVLQRGRKAVIAGDPKQLRYLSFLSKTKQHSLQRQYALSEARYGSLDYREQSLLDKAQESIQHQSQVVFLDEHYRSPPSIIAFSNRIFYQNALRMMKAAPAETHPRNVIIHRCAGQRNEAGYNPEEANALWQRVNQLIRSEHPLDPTACQSIGILSPFREQVDYLQKQVEKVYALEVIERHRLLIGTAHTFQGEERDVMFISFVLDHSAHPAAFHHLNKPDVFNVSITRARLTQHVFTSLDPRQLRQSYLVRQYLESVMYPTDAATPYAVGTTNAVIEEVADVVRAAGVTELYRAYSVAGTDVDLLVVQDGRPYCINAIGHPDRLSENFSVERYKILRRVGLPVFPFAFSDWCLNRQRTVHELMHFLQI